MYSRLDWVSYRSS